MLGESPGQRSLFTVVYAIIAGNDCSRSVWCHIGDTSGRLHPVVAKVRSVVSGRHIVTVPKHPLRVAREARHWSIDALAKTTGLSRRTILRAEQGRGLNPSTRQLLCGVFDLSAEQLGLVLRRPSLASERLATSSSEMDDLSRRQFIRLASLAGTLLAVPPAEGDLDWERMHYFDNRGRQPDNQTLEQYVSLHGQLWRTFASPDSRLATFRMAQRQLHVLTGHLERSPGQMTHRRLCALVGDLLQLAGEIFFDSNQYAEAANCYASAASAGKEAGAFDLWACAITRHAFVHVYERQFGRAVPMLELAERLALRGDDSLSTRHWVNAVSAQALAGLGEVTACQRATTRAEQVEGLSGLVHNGGWLRFDSSRLAEERGACHVELRQPDLAEAALTAALNQGLSSRRRGIVLADLAMVGVQRRDQDQLSAYAAGAVSIARETRSGVVRRRLQALRPHLAPLIANARIRQLNAEIIDLGAAFSFP